MSEVNYTEQNPWILPSGRKLWRHSNGEGCVLEFNMYGKIVQLYVPDAQYRDFTSRLISLNTGEDIQLHSPILIWNTSNYLFDSAKEISEPFTETEFLTDSQLQIKLDSFLINNSFSNDFIGKDGTNSIITSLENLPGTGIYGKAASYARTLIPTGLSPCNLPNLYELTVVWLESDNIDFIDPTVNEYSSTKLGSPNRFSNYDLWSCTEVQYTASDTPRFFGIMFNRYGYISYSGRNYPYRVLPVLELSIIDPNAPKTKLITKVVVVDKGEAYETKGVSLGESEVLTTLTSLVQEYQNTYDELNQKVTALETKYNQGRVKIVESMMELKNNPEENLLYINDEVKAIVDDGSGIIPKAYISNGNEVTLKEVERKEEDPDDGNEYIGYVNKKEWVEGSFTFEVNKTISGIDNQVYCGYDTNHGLGITMGSTSIPGFKTLAFGADSSQPNTPIAIYIYFAEEEPYSSWGGKKLKITNLNKGTSMTTTTTVYPGDGGGQMICLPQDAADYSAILTIMNPTWSEEDRTFNIKIEAVE